MSRHRTLKSILLATAASGSLAVPAIAQDTDSDEEEMVLEEIIVTARRRSESLTDVPGTVNALTSSTLANANVQRAEDFLALTPGVSLVDAAEVGDTQVNIRGINGARDAENSFAFIIDGILYTNPAAFNREFTNLQQIEVFKGPQGAIYGRNAAAGAILVTTAKPAEEFTVYGEGSVANNNSYYASLAVEGPLAEGWSYRINGDYRHTDGFFRNSFQNDEATIDRFEGANIEGRLFYDNNENFTMDIKTRYGEVDASAITFNATFHLPNFAAAFGNPAAFEDVNDHEFIFQQNVDSDNNQQAFELSGKFEYDFGPATLTFWGLYSDIKNDLIADGTSAGFGFFTPDAACQASTADLFAQGLTLPAPQILGSTPLSILFTPDFSGSFFGPYTPTTCDGIQEQERNQTDISFEFRLSSNGDGPFSWMIGSYFLDIDRQVGVSLNRDSGLEPRRGLLQLDGPNRTEALVNDDFDSRVYAFFGQTEYDVTDRFELSAAVRWDREERSVSSLVPTDATSTVIDLNGDGIFNDPLNPGLSDAVNPSGVIPDAERNFEEFQPKISATFDATDDLTLFASWGKGFKAGGFNNSGSAATINLFINNPTAPFLDALGLPSVNVRDRYGEESSSAFEVGFKAQAFDGRLRLNGAGFFTNVENMQFFEFFVGPFGLLRVVSNIDQVELYGFEIGADAAPTDWLQFYAGFAMTESEIIENDSRTDTVGNKSPYTPDYTANAGFQIDIPVTDESNVLFRADGRLIGPTWFHTVQDNVRPTIFSPIFEIAPITGPGTGGLGFGDFSNSRREEFFTLDLRLSYQMEDWSITAFFDNVTNTKFLEEVIPAPEFGGAFNAPGARQTYGVEATFRF